jgi:hypothetical protein
VRRRRVSIENARTTLSDVGGEARETTACSSWCSRETTKPRDDVCVETLSQNRIRNPIVIMGGTSWFSRTFARKSKTEKTKNSHATTSSTTAGGDVASAAGPGVGGTKTIGSSSGADEITRGVEALGMGSGSTATTASGSGTGRKMCVEDFEPLKLIGRGAFGTWRCVAILFFCCSRVRQSVGWMRLV